MTMLPLSRRSFLTGLTAGLAGLATGPARAQLFGATQPFPQYFSSFAVDVSVLKAKGLGPFADLLAAATLDQLRASFGDRFDPRGPRLVVRLTGLFQTPFTSGGGHWRHGGGGSSGGSDSLDGEALAVGARGEILARHPQLAVLDVNRTPTTPDEPGRAVEIASHYVRWLRRQLIS
ncbi:twin-arginine translocation signal domain-containing protein [Microvirga rosea]|uniref:twin-arginine translocation signal domain-containing protein n=1 Tax=Microvirga rosea TaxID=2715425 RepID=UPI001D0A76FB|nr:twin-arginine translocation signal domain-containing protein [Microvirga rosea]MCB8821526.1 twin-arginine translocation signal domain-containing protein [Microvirga rosea]